MYTSSSHTCSFFYNDLCLPYKTPGSRAHLKILIFFVVVIFRILFNINFKLTPLTTFNLHLRRHSRRTLLIPFHLHRHLLLSLFSYMFTFSHRSISRVWISISLAFSMASSGGRATPFPSRRTRLPG